MLKILETCKEVIEFPKLKSLMSERYTEFDQSKGKREMEKKPSTYVWAGVRKPSRTIYQFWFWPERKNIRTRGKSQEPDF